MQAFEVGDGEWGWVPGRENNISRDPQVRESVAGSWKRKESRVPGA